MTGWLKQRTTARRIVAVVAALFAVAALAVAPVAQVAANSTATPNADAGYCPTQQQPASHTKRDHCQQERGRVVQAASHCGREPGP